MEAKVCVPVLLVVGNFGNKAIPRSHLANRASPLDSASPHGNVVLRNSSYIEKVAYPVVSAQDCGLHNLRTDLTFGLPP